MGLRQAQRAAVAEGDLEELRVFYAALGPGFPANAESIFGDRWGNDGACDAGRACVASAVP